MKKTNKKLVINCTGYNGSEPTKFCPHCAEIKGVSEFGYRDTGDGYIRPQSWCKDCRSS